MRDILVTGGTGTTGGLIAAELTRLGIPHRVGTRRPDGPGRVLFDWDQPDAATAAMETAGAMYVVAPSDRSNHADLVVPVLKKALEVGVERMVLLSASLLEPGGPMMGQIHEWLIGTAPEWVVLRPSWFMQNFYNQHLETIRSEGKIYTAAEDGRVGFIDAADISASAVAALTAKEGWNDDYVLTGPASLSYDDAALILGEELGRPVAHVRLTVDELAARHERNGMEPDYAKTLAGLDPLIAAGAEDRVTSKVLDLTGRPPTDFRTFVRQNRERWKAAA